VRKPSHKWFGSLILNLVSRCLFRRPTRIASTLGRSYSSRESIQFDIFLRKNYLSRQLVDIVSLVSLVCQLVKLYWIDCKPITYCFSGLQLNSVPRNRMKDLEKSTAQF